jgi:hypothetical protein
MEPWAEVGALEGEAAGEGVSLVPEARVLPAEEVVEEEHAEQADLAARSQAEEVAEEPSQPEAT